MRLHESVNLVTFFTAFKTSNLSSIQIIRGRKFEFWTNG